MCTAFFQEEKRTFDQIEDAMSWLLCRAIARGFESAFEAIDLGYADIFEG